MMKRLIIIFMILLGGLAITPSASVYAQFNPLDPACHSDNPTIQKELKNSAACKQAAGQGKDNPISGTRGVINTAANIIAIVAGVGGLIMVVLGGFFFITSAGNPENVTKARQRVTAGLIGMVIVALAWAIVRFVTDRFIE